LFQANDGLGPLSFSMFHFSGCSLKKDSSLRACSFSGNDRLKRSTHERTTRETSSSSYKYLEAALIVPKSYEEKYGSNKFQTILLVIANMVSIRIRVWTFC